ncbi:outer membrane protein [Bradyrhizobium prioriisuperbiae]|uniref:outer membrane protein n=1 Tax=Bradyrhizobium prioriisuperbiae TaxID=2854389 RepID=UPI0028EACEB5|nr:outer membrane beta-barrel protein [Bradyrhizobium prioritasuperba]
MRRLVLAAVMAVMAQGAQAADLPDLSDLPILRGGFSDGLSRSSVNWQGAYIGGQFGYSSGAMDFSKATQSLTAYALQNVAIGDVVSKWTLLGKSSPTSTTFGGFVGWNSQWDDVVVGIEANYSRLSGLAGSSVNNSLPAVSVDDSKCIVPPTGTTGQCGVQLSGNASAKITDVLTLRGRAGWAVDNFMPYVFGGLAVGRANIYRAATVTETDTFYTTATPPVQAGPTITSVYSQAQSGNGVFIYGYTLGVGLEAMLFGNVFARGEYEYIKFQTVNNIDLRMNTVRAGVGYKF